MLIKSMGSLVLALVLMGCAGFQEGSSRRTAGEIIDDTLITSSINTKLLRDDKLSVFDIDVDSRSGAVVLFGNVKTAEEEQHAVELARTVKGVRSVESRLVIVP